jgi:hypothetical protein
MRTFLACLLTAAACVAITAATGLGGSLRWYVLKPGDNVRDPRANMLCSVDANVQETRCTNADVSVVWTNHRVKVWRLHSNAAPAISYQQVPGVAVYTFQTCTNRC